MTAPCGRGRAVLRSLVGVAAVALAYAVTRQAVAAQCSTSIGGRVILSSDAVDPDVFLWDSRDRLLDYTAGQWSKTKAIFAHTTLAEPGTQALVVACIPGAAHPRFAAEQDAIGVKIVTGPYRGRYGWVLSSDIRLGHSALPVGAKDTGAVNGAFSSR